MPNKDIIDQVIDQVNIAEVIGEYIQVLPDGSGFKAICPFHNDTHPSMKITPTKKIYKCFSCGNGGNVIQFVQRYEKISFNEALSKLAKRIGVELQVNHDPDYAQKKKLYDCLKESNDFFKFYLKNSEEGINALAYLKDRSIDEELIDRFNIGLAPKENDYLHRALDQKNLPLIDQVESGMVREFDGKVVDTFKNRIMFPITDLKGNIVGFSGRIYLKDDHSTTKYLNSSENLVFHKGQILYNYDQATPFIRKNGDVYIFEGFMDVIASARAGILNAVATMGTALTKMHVKALQQVANRIILCFDGDAAGIEATYHAASILSSFNIIPYAVALPERLDPDEYQRKYGSDALKKYLTENITNVFEYMYQNARSDLIINDVVSIERFKEKVFLFLRFANPTIQEFYLKKLSEDSNINIENLTKELNAKLQYSKANNDNIVEINKNTEKPKPTTIKRIENKVYRSLEIIIYHSFFDKLKFTSFYGDYQKDISPLYFGDQLELFEELGHFYQENEVVDIDVFRHKLVSESSVCQLFERIINNSVYDINNEQEYDDSLKTFKLFLKNSRMQEKYKSALSSNQADVVKDYIDAKRDLTK